MPSEPFDYLEQHEYHHGLCACYKDPLICIVGLFGPCCLIGKTAADLDGKGSFDCVSCICGHVAAYRNRRLVQARDNIHESERGSVIASSMCILCSSCQDAHQTFYRPSTRTENAQTEAPTSVAAPTMESQV